MRRVGERDSGVGQIFDPFGRRLEGDLPRAAGAEGLGVFPASREESDVAAPIVALGPSVAFVAMVGSALATWTSSEGAPGALAAAALALVPPLPARLSPYE